MAIGNALAHQHLVKEKSELEKYLHQARDGYTEMVGKSASIERLRDRIELAAASPLDILITGESGTGKELVARAIHRTGRRKSGKFIPVDCGSLADSLAEAELFGFRKGAFTGAVENREGLIEAANGGILFLDEISNLPFHLQAKLLRVLPEREVRRLGETMPHKIDIQVVAATNKDLLEEVRNGQFRSDLYYRLKGFEIRVPPLRERPEDIPLLIEWFLEKIAELEQGSSRRFLPEALELMTQYTYPGNVRELRNIVSGSYYSTAKTSIGIDDLPPEVRCEDSMMFGSESNAAKNLYREILEGRGNFDNLVKQPFLRRHFGTSLVMAVIQMALKDSGGKYRDAFSLLRVPETRYSVTMQFLKRNKCYLDFRPFRRRRR
jgi:transcriptional regulator with GAF, ATPase, and Fis domain